LALPLSSPMRHQLAPSKHSAKSRRQVDLLPFKGLAPQITCLSIHLDNLMHDPECSLVQIALAALKCKSPLVFPFYQHSVSRFRKGPRSGLFVSGGGSDGKRREGSSI
jgi:hypothetical protein